MKKVVKILLIISIILAIAIVFILIKLNNKEKNDNTYKEEIIIVEKKEMSLVHNRSDFYTVSSCVNIYLNYLVSQNEDIILNILDEGFKAENGINESNVLNKVDNFKIPQVFTPQKMYYEINNNIRYILCVWNHN